MIESFENKKTTFDVKSSLEKIEGVLNVEKLELSDEYFSDIGKDKDFSSNLFKIIKNNYESLDVYKTKYLSDGLAISGFIWTPKGVNEKLPVVVWNRGGSMTFSCNGDKKGTPFMGTPCELSKYGAIVLGSEYRGGLDSEGKDEWGGGDVDDVVNLREIVEKLPISKKEKSIVVGASRGGMMSYKLASREPWVKGVISIAGTADLAMSAEERPAMLEIFKECFGGKEDEMKKRSATEFYKQIPKDLPLLIMHGTADNRVSVDQARKLNSLLVENGNNVEYHEFEGADHYLSQNRKEKIELITDFLNKNI